MRNVSPPTPALARSTRLAITLVLTAALLAAVVPYSPSAEALGVDPELVFVTTGGGPDRDNARSLVIDSAGNSYLTGRFEDTADFDGNPSTTFDKRTATGSASAYVVSYDASGTFRWVIAITSPTEANSIDIAIDSSGNVYVTGEFSDLADFDGDATTLGDRVADAGNGDAFIASYDSNGNYRWAIGFGAADYEQGRAIAVDGSGNTYVTGQFEGTIDFDGDLTTTTDQRIADNFSVDYFLASYGPAGAFRWAISAGGDDSDYANDMALDSAGNIFIAGEFNDTGDFDGNTTTTADKRTSIDSTDVFLVSYDNAGIFRWVTTVGGLDREGGESVAIDDADNLYITGNFEETADFDGNPATAADLRSTTTRDAFVASYDPNGTFRWVATATPTVDMFASAGTVDGAGNVYITGDYLKTTDFDGDPLTVDDQLTDGPIFGREFVASYDTDGQFRWSLSTDAGGNGSAIAADGQGNVFVAGRMSGVGDFDDDLSTTADQRTSNGNNDYFLMRLSVIDEDGDGFEGPNGDGADCDDTDAAINPLATDMPYNGVDENCSGADLVDVDGDGSPSTAATGGTPDCDDGDPAINPAAVDVVGDGIDQDCDGVDASAATCNGLTVTIDMNLGATGFGTAGDDVILGTPGNDVIDGLAGDDTICGEDGDDNISGSAGVDFIFGGDGNDTMTGGDGNDRIRGQKGVDDISGGDGNDFLYGGVEGDTIDGDDGNDTIGGFGGADTIDGGPGNDRIFGGFGADTINGGDGDDKILGLVGNDLINGDAGDDELNGDNGQDTINGGPGNDTIKGGNSLDTLFGDDGDDNVAGGRSDDTLSGGPGNDTCTGNTETIADTADTTCETIFGVP